MNRLAAIALGLVLSTVTSAAVLEPRFDRLGIEDGLSQSSGIGMLFDSRGWLWIGTEDGLNRYDGYNFKVYRHNPKDPSSLGSGYVISIMEDSTGALWVGTEGGGLNRLDRQRDRFERFVHDPDDANSLVDDRIQVIIEDRQGRLWIGTNNGISRLSADRTHFTNYAPRTSDQHGMASAIIWTIMQDHTGTVWIGSDNGLYRYLGHDDKFLRYTHDANDPGSLGSNTILSLLEDSAGRIWIGTYRGEVGLNLWDSQANRFIRFASDSKDPFSIGSNHVISLAEDPNSPGTLWIGTRTAGLVRFDIEAGRFYNYGHDPARTTSISNDRVSTIAFDRAGTLWAGTYDAGLNRLHRRHDQWVHYTNDPSDLNSIPDNYVRSIAEDKNGTLWIGTYDGGLARFGPERDRFITYQHNSNDPASLSHNEVRNVYVDRTGDVWAATYYGGLNRLDPASGMFTRYFSDPADPGTISDNRVMAVQEDGFGALWVGTENGLDRFDRSTGTFRRYHNDPDDPDSLSVNRIYALYTDHRGDLWVATLGGGLDRYDYAIDGFIHHRHDPDNPDSLPNDTVLAVTEDSANRLWTGTLGGGLALLDREEQTFSTVTTDNGLPNNVIYGIVEDHESCLWVSTNDGLARYNPENGSVRSYTVGDGLLSNEFSAKAYARTSRGEIAFGSTSGLTLFSPDDLKDSALPPPVVIIDLKLFGDSVVPGPGSLLSTSIEDTHDLVLSHRDSVISFEFTALDYVAPSKNRYAYRLEGFDDNWRNVDSAHRFATYTNLPAGDYMFRVRAANSDGVWNNEGATIAVRVLPPPWLSWWAYTLYALFLFALFIIERRRALNRIWLQGQIELEQIETEKLKEVDQLKSKFFANISHEFRTPLALILGPIDELLKDNDDPGETSGLELIQRNAKRLQRLVEQLMDLSRLEGGSMKLQPQPGDLVDFVRGLTMAFESIARRKGIGLVFSSDQKSLFVDFDQEQVEIMLVNLLSNAFKSTLEDGRVEVSLICNSAPETAAGGTVEVILLVRDTGIGISEAYQANVFDRFYQVDSSETREQEGTGIGLALVRELAQLHGGKVTLKSRPGEGSEFRLQLQFNTSSSEAISRNAGLITNTPVPESVAGPEPVQKDQTADDDTIVLLIEDNAELRAFISRKFGSGFSLIEAGNGFDGLKMAIELVPDLVICDVMMPKMDGYAFCEELKSDERTSHIPILMLTAMAGKDEKLKGLKLGADDYLTKPFDSEELLARARNLVEQRRHLRQHFSGTVVLKPAELDVSSVDRAFLKRALAIVEAHMGNDDLSVEALAAGLNLSRSQLHRKLKALTNQTPTTFIRTIRLERAAQLLRSQAGTVGAIAYQVGFSSQAYFTQCFHDQFGCTPSVFAKQEASDKPHAT